MCFSFSHLLSLLSVYISTHAFFTILFHYFLFGIFHFLTSLCSFFISCNIFLLFFICFLLLPSYEFLFLYFYVYFVNFYEWKNCFFLSSSLLRTEGETPNVYWQTNTTELFSSNERIYWDIIFTSLFMCFFFFPIFMLSFNLPFSSSSTFSLIF